jgi:hypothetical protein
MSVDGYAQLKRSSRDRPLRLPIPPCRRGCQEWTAQARELLLCACMPWRGHELAALQPPQGSVPTTGSSRPRIWLERESLAIPRTAEEDQIATVLVI